jgi:hypothetical protein
MRVLLVDPVVPGLRGRRGGSWTPLGLAYLAAALHQAGHQVSLHNRLNMQAWQNLSLEELDGATERLLQELRPELIGISGVTASFGDSLAVADIARRACPQALVVRTNSASTRCHTVTGRPLC